MIIKKIQTMEKIVKNNSNLFWDGWDVVDLKESNIAQTSPIGIRVKNKWYIHKKYVVTRNGWDIPNKYRD